MIIQKVVKGLYFNNTAAKTIDDQIDYIFKNGLFCNLWRNNPNILYQDMLQRLTSTEIDLHQNNFDDPYPGPSDPPYSRSTPFISTTAGTVNPDTLKQRNVFYSARITALRFATDGWRYDDAWLVYGYVFVLGKPSVEFVQFSEELRELNIYTGWSSFQPEGEVTAKLIIPSCQIEKIEHWKKDATGNYMPIQPYDFNTGYILPETILNMREILS